MDVLVLADDATGALETGAQLADRDFSPRMALGTDPEWTADVLVVDTETRHVTGEVAQARLQSLAQQAKGRGVQRIYKKTDSTLRGNIGAEFQALLDVFPDHQLVYVPAWPALGRTVTNGSLFVNGIPLERIASTQSPGLPIRSGSIRGLLMQTCRLPVQLATAPSAIPSLLADWAESTVVLCDGSAEEDLEAVASILAEHKGPYIAAGPSGFLGYWAERLRSPTRRLPAPVLPVLKSCLIVSGSLHPLSVQQVSDAESEGLPVFHLSPVAPEDPALSLAVAEALKSQPWIVLATSPEIDTTAEGIATRLAAITRTVLLLGDTEALVIFGGDTTLAVLRALGNPAVEPWTELMPGVPLSQISFAGRRLAVITKAGGFGPANILSRIRQCQQPTE